MTKCTAKNLEFFHDILNKIPSHFPSCEIVRECDQFLFRNVMHYVQTDHFIFYFHDYCTATCVFECHGNR